VRNASFCVTQPRESFTSTQDCVLFGKSSNAALESDLDNCHSRGIPLPRDRTRGTLLMPYAIRSIEKGELQNADADIAGSKASRSLETSRDRDLLDAVPVRHARLPRFSRLVDDSRRLNRLGDLSPSNPRDCAPNILHSHANPSLSHLIGRARGSF